VISLNYIRVKTNIYEESIQDRLKYNPEIIEFHLNERDLEDLDFLIKRIREIKGKGVAVYLHHPMKKGEQFLDILSNDEEIKAYYDWSTNILADICEQEDIYCVIHANYSGTLSSVITKENTLKVKERIESFLQIPGGNRLLWEDSIEGVFSYQNPYLFSHIIKPLELSITVDISHSFIALKGNNEVLQQVVKETAPYAKYYHVVDSLGAEHDSLELGKGRIEWENIVSYLQHKPFIFEIGLEPPFTNCLPMIKSADYFKQLLHTHAQV
jgi:hypothetical protein